MSALAATTHAVYRGFDTAGQVVYVGCTADLDRRIRQHQDGVGRQIVRWDSRTYATRADALRVESALIFFHQPRLNTLGLHREPWIQIPRPPTARERKRASLRDIASAKETAA